MVALPFKMSLLVAGTLIVFGLVVGTFGIDHFSSILRAEAIRHGKAVASTLASSLIEIIATQQDAAVSTAIRSAKRMAGLAYVEVVDADDTLIAHTYEGNPPWRAGRVRQEATKIRDDTVAGQGVIDIPAEVVTGAVIHVGLDRSAIEAKVSRARLVVIGLTVLEVLLALLAMFWAVRPFVRHLSDTNRELETNVHKLQETQAQLRVARDASDEANRAKSQFLANMSHELRTPLNAIIGYSEMLIEDAEDQEQPETILDLKKIHLAGKHLLALISDILDLSKIEAGKMDICLETFDVSNLINEVVSTVQPIVAANASTLHLKVAADIGTMHSDLTKIRQSMLNLLSNACKFTEQGTIWLQADRETVDGSDWLTFRIRDTGIGMTLEQMEKLFKEFMQADSSTTRKYGGTGLGLAITRRFCRLLGGDVVVESALGQGSTFTIRLPGYATTQEATPEASVGETRIASPAEAVPRATREYLPNVSYESRTPLNGMLGMTDLALDTEPTSEQRKCLTVVKVSGNSC
jgi:signal transduction histidine kinase